MNKLLTLLAIALLFVISSCVDIFDEVILHKDGSGTYKYSINMSASKVKINSILALDSINGRRVPKLQEIKDKIALYRQKLEEKPGISNVLVDANYTDFVFKISCDFESIADLQTALHQIMLEESSDRNDAIFSQNWITWDGHTMVRSIPNLDAPIHKLKPEDQELLKNGKYISVTRFDVPVLKCENPNAQISPSKTAVMLKSNTYAVAKNPSLLQNTILVQD